MRELPSEPVHRLAHEAMGTIFEVLISGQEAGYAVQASQAVFQEIDRLEALFSRFNPRARSDRSTGLAPMSR
jgi:hypothetical protein